MNISKKAVSEMVSYVLLIVIAVGVSVGVYSFLSSYTPKDHAECTADVKLILQSYECNAGDPGRIAVSLLNKGVFSVDAAYIRFGAVDSKVKTLINNEEGNTNNGLYFIDGLETGLKPGAVYVKEMILDKPIVSGKYGLEIQPAVFSENNELALCSQATITQEIDCS